MIFDSLGVGEMGVVLALAILLIEPKKLGKVMKEFAKFKRKVSDIQADVKSQLDAITREEDARERIEKVQDDKEGMRKWGRDQVKTQSSVDRAEAAKSLVQKIVEWPTYGHAKVVACFAGSIDELDTEPLLQRILADGKTLLLPFIQKDERFPETSHTNNESSKVTMTSAICMAPVNDLERDLKEGTFGILEPVTALRPLGERLIPDLIFVPGTCFDLRGGRIGQGKGFYDRYLVDQKAIKVGLALDVQITQKNLTLDPHDQFMDVLVSEKRMVFFSSPRVDVGP